MPANSPKTSTDLNQMYEDGQFYELLLVATRMWLEKCHPELSHGAVYGFHRDDTPPVRITVSVSSSADCSAH